MSTLSAPSYHCDKRAEKTEQELVAFNYELISGSKEDQIGS